MKQTNKQTNKKLNLRIEMNLESWSCNVVRAAVPGSYHNSSSPDGFVAQENENVCGEC